LSQGEIAFVCGCSKAYIYLVEKTAMGKLRRALEHRRDVFDLLTN
jgi:DNA-directed RNA polymerase specialized sigma subunit